MFDTHAHLNFPGVQLDPEHVIKAAREAGVEHITVPGVDIATSESAVAIAEKHENVYAAVGVHPEDTQDSSGELEREIVPALTKLAQSPKVVAIGEIGLDRYSIERSLGAFDQAVFDQQKKFFRLQFALAQSLDLSVIIHCRQAKDELLQELRELWSDFYTNKVVIHCCEPEKDLLDFARQKGAYVGVDGDVTYNKEKQEFIRNVPLSRLVLETDSPFLTPEPVRSDKARKFPNTPANLPIIAQEVAKLQGVDLEDVKKQTVENAMALFSLNSA